LNPRITETAIVLPNYSIIYFWGGHGSAADNPITRKIESQIIETPLFYVIFIQISIIMLK
jgi:hypothetical protein